MFLGLNLTHPLHTKKNNESVEHFFDHKQKNKNGDLWISDQRSSTKLPLFPNYPKVKLLMEITVYTVFTYSTMVALSD